MNLSDPKIREEYINHILGLMSEEKISRELLDQFIIMTTRGEEKFPISSEDAATFLNISTDKIIELICENKNYEKNINYIENEEKYLLTVNCFEDICLRTRSVVGKQIRLYYRVASINFEKMFVGNISQNIN